MSKDTKIFSVFSVLLSIILGLGIFQYSVMGHFVSNWWTDYKTVEFGTPQQASDEMVLVVITENTLADLTYRSPIDRQFLAETISTLMTKGAKVVAIDLLFDQPTELQKDDALKSVFKEYSSRIAIASANTNDGLGQNQINYQSTILPPNTGMKANLGKDTSDGVVRWLYEKEEKNDLPTFVEKILSFHNTKIEFRAQGHQRLVYPLDEQGTPLKFATFDANKVSLLPDHWFKDKLVLLGVDLPAIDKHRTPFSNILGDQQGNFAGIHLHALGINQYLNQYAWQEVTTVGLVLSALLSAVIGSLWVKIPVWTSLKIVLGVVAIAIVMMVDIFAFKTLMYLHFPISIIFCAIFSFSISAARHYLQEKEYRQYLHYSFSHYVSEDVIARIVQHPESLKIGGEEKEMTFIFTDLEDFTNLSEQCKPEELVKILNEYNSLISKILHRHNATIDKFSGDGLNAFFGAPLYDQDHAQNAFECALAIQKATDEFSETYKNKGVSVGKTRIGVHSGLAIVGNFGGEERFQYTVLGDAVNIASRLEGLNKFCGTSTMISQQTVDLLSDGKARPVGEFILKGKNKPIVVYEPLDNDQDLGDYLALYKAIKSDDPNQQKLVEEYLEEYPNDPIVQYYHARNQKNLSGVLIKMDQK